MALIHPVILNWYDPNALGIRKSPPINQTPPIGVHDDAFNALRKRQADISCRIKNSTSVKFDISTMRSPTLKQITFISSMGVGGMIFGACSKTRQAEAEK